MVKLPANNDSIREVGCPQSHATACGGGKKKTASVYIKTKRKEEVFDEKWSVLCECAYNKRRRLSPRGLLKKKI